MKKISLKGLAGFMTAGHARQRSILRTFKYPQDEEARAKITYYREARDRVAAYHKAVRDAPWLLAEAHYLDGLAALSVGRTATRLAHNARALRAYARHFSGRGFQVLQEVTLQLQYEDVLVSVHPDLHIREGKQEKIVKLEFVVEEPSDEFIKIVTQAMFEAAQSARMRLPPSAVLLFDVPRGTAHKGARLGARMRRELEAACENISAIWDKIEPT